MSELKLCPFCGNEVDNHKDDCYFRLYSVALADSLVFGKAGMHVHVSARELSEAWDTRTERTCVPRVVPRSFSGDSEPSFYQAICDCGWIVGEDGASSLSDFEHIDTYCGGCGAKVVAE